MVFTVTKSNLETTAKRLDALCRAHHVTRSDLAQELGMTRSAVSQKFSGGVRFTLRDISRLADLFEVSTDYLMGRSDAKEPKCC